MQINLEIATPRWALPLLGHHRYKGARGGRAGGRSHFFAEAAVEEMVCDPDLRFVCVREIQRSLKYSAKSLVEKKIQDLGVSSLFTVLQSEIRRNYGTGVMIFEGMQDHTKDSIKSLEGFGRAWVEEAQNLSGASMELLLPTIRAPGSEVWFSWNPYQPTDPVEELFGNGDPAKIEDDAVCVTHSYLDNPFCTDEIKAEAARLQRVDPEAYAHVWLGKYWARSDAQVLSGKWVVDDFTPQNHWNGPYFGADWGFAQDPTVLVRFWEADNKLWIEYETRGIGWTIDDTERKFSEVPDSKRFAIRADSSHPQTIAEIQARGFKIEAAQKWKGSVEDGIARLRNYEKIVIHPRCTGLQDEARMWRYKTDSRTGDVLPRLKEGWDHGWDAIRYGLAPIIRGAKTDLNLGASLGDDLKLPSQWRY